MLEHAAIDISSRIYSLEQNYFTLGEFSDVYKGSLDLPGFPERQVAIKVIRGYTSSVDRRMNLAKDIEALVVRWRKFRHRNIMECFGIANGSGQLPGLVLPLCSGGTITEYVRYESSARKLDLLLQVTSALKYLHHHDFVHADVRGANILMENGNPLLMDGGLAPLLDSGDFTGAGVNGRLRWMAPEILDPPEELIHCGASPYTLESDVYSLGMTILEVMTGNKPYCHRRYDTIVMLDVVRGIKPNRPLVSVVADGVWCIMEACWGRAEDRPSAVMVEAWINLVRYVEADCIQL